MTKVTRARSAAVPAAIVEGLQAIPYFAPLPAGDLASIGTRCTVRAFKRGEIVFDGGGYVATAIAIDDARVLFVPRPVVLAACRRHGDVALGVIAVLARRVRAFAGLIEDLALRDVTARVAAWLLAEVRRGGADTV